MAASTISEQPRFNFREDRFDIVLIETFFLVKTNVIRMLIKRGYDIEQYELDYLWDDFEDYPDKFNAFYDKIVGDEGNASTYYTHSSKGIMKTAFLGFRDIGNIAKDTAQSVLNAVNEENTAIRNKNEALRKSGKRKGHKPEISNLMVITASTLKPESSKILNSDGVNTGLKIEFFNKDDVLIDPEAHSLAPVYELLAKEDIADMVLPFSEDKAGTKHDIRKFPSIMSNDALVRKRDWTPGSTVRIKQVVSSRGGPATSMVEYRNIVRSKS